MFVLSALFALALLAAGIAIWIWVLRRTIRRLEKQLSQHRRTQPGIRHYDGKTDGWIDYRSFDGGLHWYEVEESDAGERVIREVPPKVAHGGANDLLLAGKLIGNLLQSRGL